MLLSVDAFVTVVVIDAVNNVDVDVTVESRVNTHNE